MIKGRKVYEKIRSVADAALFFDDVCMYWATGFYSTDGVVIIDGEATKLCVDSRYYEAACNAKESGALFDDVEVILLDKGVVDAVKTHAKGETYAVDSELVTVARLERLKKAFEGKTVVTQENMKCIVRLCSQCFQLPDDIMLSVIGGQDYINRCIHRGCRFPQALLSEGRFPVPDVYSCRTVC